MLRRWLGSNASLRFGAGTYQLNPQLQLVADVRTFDASLARAHSANDESSVQALGRAVDVYRGPLLADVAWQWVDPLREAYRARYVAAALRLADLVRNTDLARSDGLAERVIELEPENEAAYERLLLNARARGDALAAHRIARRYEAAATRLGFAANPYLLQAR
jgi:DNA-binding SARP family transcriptional activator